jgi:hypothetical protein
MMRKAKMDEERVRVREIGGRRSSGGRGWADSSQLNYMSLKIDWRQGLVLTGHRWDAG